MNKLLEVREFDSIIGNAEYANDGNYRYLEKDTFNKLIDFIHEYTSDDGTEDILKFMKISYKRNVGEIVTIRNYVGLIEMKNGYQIQVLPKIDLNNVSDTDNNTETKRIFLKMLRSMKDFPIKVFTDSNLKIDKMNLYEIFISMYLQEVRQLIKHGIKSSYIESEDNLNYFKGKLDVNKHIKANAAHKERFYMIYDEFHQNRPENRLIKATLLKLNKLTSSFKNSKEIKQLLVSFENVESSVNYQKDFSSVVIDRTTKDYDIIMKWSKVFLLNKSFTTFSGADNSRALLFPMEKIFESYIAMQIKKRLCPDGWDVSSQDRGYYLFDEPQKKFALQPDIVLKKDTKTVIMDTKWKRLFNNKNKNYGISQNDMYQMYAYSKKYNTSETWLIYPINDDVKNLSICFKSNDNTNVHVFFVDLGNIEKSIDKLVSML